MDTPSSDLSCLGTPLRNRCSLQFSLKHLPFPATSHNELLNPLNTIHRQSLFIAIHSHP